MSDLRLVLSKCLNILDLQRPNMEDFDERLRLQKIVYLLWAYGISLGYGFNWYVRGPYSPKLASDGYTIDDELFERGRGIRFNNEEEVVESLNRFKEILGNNMDHSILIFWPRCIISKMWLLVVRTTLKGFPTGLQAINHI